MEKKTEAEQKTIDSLQANWVWVSDWADSSPINTAGRLVRFTRKFNLSSSASRALLHFSADTRYKLFVNGEHVATGPSRGSPLIWYYDTLDIANYLQAGDNEITFVVLRYFASSRGAMPFERTPMPGFTIIGSVETATETVNLEARKSWEALVDESVEFPMGLVDDVFLHISERIKPVAPITPTTPIPYNIKSVNGELPPWRLRSRCIPPPEMTDMTMNIVKFCESDIGTEDWTSFFSHKRSLTLSPRSRHVLELQADVHATAFLRWVFNTVDKPSEIRLRTTYSEGYELEPRSYPFFRSKADRLDASTGHILGPYDDVTLEVHHTESTVYEPFWFRTFRILRLEVSVGTEAVLLSSFKGTQVNYPLDVKASWSNPGDPTSKGIWDVSIRTLRNCMFDGYSDCPFYEQLQYSGDSRSVGLFHYLLSGDDRLMRQAITNFGASITPEGLTQSRFPSHVPQIVAGFSLYWILQICDHHLFFGDTRYSRSFLPRIDGVLDFFDSHVDELGLVSGMPDDVWQYVDWVTTWGATDDHPDKGVPTSGRKSNRHTYFSMLYAYVLMQAARLVRGVGRPGNAAEYESRAESILQAIRKHCYDGQYFTDSTADVADDGSYSQHCQVFAVLSGAAQPSEIERLLLTSFNDPKFSKCSYMMRFYALRALAMTEGSAYEELWDTMWAPWRQMLANNLTTWEEDDVRQRSDCHAWGSVPIYEYCTEVAGVSPLEPGCSKILFKPRLSLGPAIEAKVPLGRDNLASVSWAADDEKNIRVRLQLSKAILVVSQLPGGEIERSWCHR
ncbi:uncharacterized protein N7483_013044 [Penicillium malachiteum]|uniref:uncharacterized protein n=1 Tax=Penicillium malachiteum TaxID=1324776 RepID=UPI0025466158|nr:uncharacterized protein N7483_013044 [Penicillium malachiteum]KAJ5715863.1 hypothetical protein N7483_013044 [Penicillium malachiteum]